MNSLTEITKIKYRYPSLSLILSQILSYSSPIMSTCNNWRFPFELLTYSLPLSCPKWQLVISRPASLTAAAFWLLFFFLFVVVVDTHTVWVYFVCVCVCVPHRLWHSYELRKIYNYLRSCIVNFVLRLLYCLSGMFF